MEAAGCLVVIHCLCGKIPGAFLCGILCLARSTSRGGNPVHKRSMNPRRAPMRSTQLKRAMVRLIMTATISQRTRFMVMAAHRLGKIAVQENH